MSIKYTALSGLLAVTVLSSGCSGTTTETKADQGNSSEAAAEATTSGGPNATVSKTSTKTGTTEKAGSKDSDNKDTAKKSSYPQDFDSCGQKMPFSKQPEKIVSVGVVGLNNLVAAGAAERIVARAGEYGQPPSKGVAPAVKGIKVASSDPLTLEAAVKYKADLIYGEGYSSTAASPKALQAKGVNAAVPATQCSYFYPEQKSAPLKVADIPKEIRRLGTLLNTQEKAEKSASKLEKQLKQVAGADKSKAVKKVAVVYHYDDTKEFYSFGAENMVDDMISTMGYSNATDPKYQYHKGPLAPDAFIKSDPDVVIVAWGASGKDFEDSKKRLEAVPGVSKMRAFKQGNVIGMDNAATFPTPLTIEELQRVSESIAKVDDVG